MRTAQPDHDHHHLFGALMNGLHSLLKRQLKRFTEENIPLTEEPTGFLQAINDAYWQFDADRAMLEHSLDLTSLELLERNAELSRVNAELETRVMERTLELSGSEARFRALFEYAPISIWEEDFSAARQYIDDLHTAGVTDLPAYLDAHPEAVAEIAPSVKIVDVNRATLDMYQAESKSQLLADLSKVLGPESLLPFRRELLALARGETPFEIETVNYTLRGERRLVLVRLTLAPGYSDTWAKVFVSISDITERRQTEADLIAERDLLQALMDNIPDTIYFKDAASRFTRVNWAQAEMLGVPTPEHAIGKTDLEFFLPELAKGFYEEEQRLFATGEALINRIEFNPAPDGKPRWLSATKIPIKDKQGRVTGLVGVSRNITGIKQAEEALHQSEERFRFMSWATKDALWDWDLQGNKIWWGDGLQKILHYPSGAAQPDPEWRLDHIHPEDRVKVDQVISQALEEGMEFWSKEYRFQRHDGTYAEIMDRGYILHDETGKPYRMIGAMMDITERKQSEETIRHQNEMLSSLHQITLDLLRYREVDQLLDALVELCAKFLDVSYVQLMLVEGQELVVKATTQNQSRLIGQRMTHAQAMLSWQAVDTREPAVLTDYARWPNRQAIYDEFLPHAVADFPILNDDQCLGVIALGRDKPDYEFTLDQIQYGDLFANLTALVLNNAQLREALLEQSIRDPLTGLYNRRYMQEMLGQHISRVTRHLHPLGVIMIDIDPFKSFNDTHGHVA
ncbi:MAG TPA: PAS domain S-box protein, partial [Anaerolineales bacterium]